MAGASNNIKAPRASVYCLGDLPLATSAIGTERRFAAMPQGCSRARSQHAVGIHDCNSATEAGRRAGLISLINACHPLRVSLWYFAKCGQASLMSAFG